MLHGKCRITFFFPAEDEGLVGCQVLIKKEKGGGMSACLLLVTPNRGLHFLFAKWKVGWKGKKKKPFFFELLVRRQVDLR